MLSHNYNQRGYASLFRSDILLARTCSNLVRSNIPVLLFADPIRFIINVLMIQCLLVHYVSSGTADPY
jgi:hypothetical protein